MERLVEFAELKEEVKKIEHFVARCQGLFFSAGDYADKYARQNKIADAIGEGSGLNAALTAALVQAWRGKWRDKLDDLTLISHYVDGFGWFAACVPTVALDGYRMPKKMVLGSPSLYRETESRRGNERGESRKNDGFDPRKIEQFLAVLFAKTYLPKVSEVVKKEND